jgi:hypothetical protein
MAAFGRVARGRLAAVEPVGWPEHAIAGVGQVVGIEAPGWRYQTEVCS